MRRAIMSLLAGVFVVFGVSALAGEGGGHDQDHSKAKTAKAELDKAAPNFTLADADGKDHSLSDFSGKYVVLEWTNMDCPFVRKHYSSGNMQSLQKKYAEKGVAWLRICSSGPGQEGNFDAKIVAARLEKDKAMQTAYLVDTDGAVGRAYGAKTTPHMFVIDPKGTLIYAGGIDDKPSTKVADVKGATNYVAECLDAAMAGKPVKVKSSSPYGCSVKYKKSI